MSTIQTYTQAAAAAIVSGDYATARTNLLAASALLAGTPTDSMQGDARIAYQGQMDAIRNLTAELNRLAAQSAGVIQIPLEYQSDEADE